MFYAHFVLSKKGPLARIWLAAHWDKKLTKAHIFDTSIEGSVEAIIQPQVKLALRTSGHLLLGVVRIYSRKAKYLLADCNEVFVKIRLSFRPGMSVDLPEDTREAPFSAITLPENFHDFELETAVTEVPDFSEPFNETLLPLQSVPERITLREPTRHDTYLGSDGFGDFGFEEFGPSTFSAEFMAEYQNADQNLMPLPEINFVKSPRKSARVTRASKLLDDFGGVLNENPDQDVEPAVVDVPMDAMEQGNDGVEPTTAADVTVETEKLPELDETAAPIFDETLNTTAGQVGGLFEETLAGGDMTRLSDAEALMSPETRSMALKKKADELYEPGEEEALPIETKMRRKTRSMTAADQTTATVDQTLSGVDQTVGGVDQTVDVGDQTTRTNVPDQTTLIQNVSQAFALAPIDTTALNTTERKKKKKRKLIVDDTKALSSETIKGHLRTTAGITCPMDLAPPTKKLMQWKDIGTIERLLMEPAYCLNKKLQKVFTRNLVTVEDKSDFDAVDDDVSAAADISDIEIMRRASQQSLDESEVEKRRGTADRSSLMVDHSILNAGADITVAVDDQNNFPALDISMAPPVEPSLDSSILAAGNLTLVSLDSPSRAEPRLQALDITLTEDLNGSGRRSSARLRGRRGFQLIPPSPLALPFEGTLRRSGEAASVAGTPRKAGDLVAGTPRKSLELSSVAGSPSRDRDQSSLAETPRRGLGDRASLAGTPRRALMEIPQYPLSPQIIIEEPRNISLASGDENAFDFGTTRRDEDLRCSGHVLLELEQEEADAESALHRRTAYMLKVLGSQFDLLQASETSKGKRKSKSCVSSDVTFSDLLCNNSRKQVAAKFASLLVLRKLQAVEVKQSSPYEEIYIKKGAKFADITEKSFE